MNKLIVMIYSPDDVEHMKRLKSDLTKKGFNVFTGDLSSYGNDWTWREVRKRMKICNAVVVMLPPSAKDMPQIEPDLTFVRTRNIPIIPIVSAADKYETELETLSEQLRATPKSNYEIVHDEFQQITEHIPDVRWIRIIHIDGFAVDLYRFDTGNIRRDTEADIEEDRYSPISVWTLSLSEHIASEFVLGNFQFTVVSGQDGTHFLIPIGDGTKWILSIAVKGYPSPDKVFDYFESRDYLAVIAPLIMS